MSIKRSQEFASDTTSPVYQKVLEAMVNANSKMHLSYGNDAYTKRLNIRINYLFDQKATALVVPSGTGGNCLGMSILLTKRTEAAFIAWSGHMAADECAVIESNLGNKLICLPSSDGKITIDALEEGMRSIGNMFNRANPKVVSISQPTEYGTAYSVDELKTISKWCERNSMRLHIDGSRLANALIFALKDAEQFLYPKEMFKDCKFDALTFGFTKNGGFAGDVVVIPESNPIDEEDLRRLHTQLMQLPAKTWAVSAGIHALLNDDKWLFNAEKANTMALRLYSGVVEILGEEAITQPVQTNAVFCKLTEDCATKLGKKYVFYPWHKKDEFRFMTSYTTTSKSVDLFLRELKKSL